MFEQIKLYGQIDYDRMKKMDAYIGIRATSNTAELNGISKKVMELYNKYYTVPVHFEERVKNTKWCILRYPNNSMAQMSKMNKDEFEDGKIIKATSNKTKELNEILDTDDGARYIGEFAIGLNPYIENPIGDTLFDEKNKGKFSFYTRR